MADIDTNRDTYVFLCGNVREKLKSCGGNAPFPATDYFKQILKTHKDTFVSGRSVRATSCGCLGRCLSGPVLVVFPDNVWYTYSNQADIDEIISTHLVLGQEVKRLQIAAPEEADLWKPH